MIHLFLCRKCGYTGDTREHYIPGTSAKCRYFATSSSNADAGIPTSNLITGGETYPPWTEDDKARLEGALGNMFGRDKSKAPETPMTLNDAITHAQEKVDDSPCGKNHGQLVRWLMELRSFKEAKPQEPVGQFTVFGGKSINQVIKYETHLPEGAYPIYAAPQPCQRCAEWGEAWDGLNETTGKKIAALEAELERERIRLAACGVVALANTSESAAKHRQMLPEYRSGSLDAVIPIVDSEMALRVELARYKDLIEEQRLSIVALNTCVGGEGSLTTDNLTRVGRLDADIAKLKDDKAVLSTAYNQLFEAMEGLQEIIAQQSNRIDELETELSFARNLE